LNLEKGENIFNDVAIFSVFSTQEDERLIFFLESFTTEVTTTTTTTTTSTTTTTRPPQLPSAKITGISDGDRLEEGKIYEIFGTTSSDPDGTIDLYEWFVDGTKKVQGPDETSFNLITEGFLQGRAYEIQLRVTDNDGLVSLTTITISIETENIDPIAKAGEDISILEGTNVTLSAGESSDPDGEIVTYKWSEDGIVFSSEIVVENETFSLGKHTITLEVTDDQGATSTDMVVITVFKENIPPNAVAGEDKTVTEGDSVLLSAKESNDPDGNITAYLWIFPDGQVQEKLEFNVTFPAGTHKVRLNVTDDKGAVGEDETTITVKSRPTTFERIRIDYGSEIKISLLTIAAFVISLIIFLRSKSGEFY
jgi:hypothetical protein